ncbi:TrmH family RNA methyltransferase [Flaviflexus huanghaiensis]|uniref:TrmH family RNA methyltransferase n=1 Tax=Flaviflexus huanghaiensis TaxID=1111473 RepID=UPI0015FB34D2|nr:RNA methyltransferase [Flaviflexus huanghaiensis]
MRRYHDTLSGQLVKIQGLYQAKNRATYSQEIAEGPQAAREALTWAGDRVRDVLMTEEALDRHPDLARLAESHWTHVLPSRVLGQITGDSQGVLVVLNTAPTPSIEDVLTDAMIAVLAVEMQDPGNAGTLIRTADAAGAAGVFFGSGSADPASPKVIRSAAGSTYHLPIVGSADPRTVIAHAKKRGLQVLAADGNGDKTLGGTGLDLGRPTLWVFGNEARGLAPDLLTRADESVAIPIPGRSESLNVSAAAAVCLYASVFAQSA